nr:hypothetical protein Hi04_10k_c5714_00029 [uncultured bacterium]
MNTKFMKTITIAAAGLFLLGTAAYAQNRDAIDTRTSHPVMQATGITKEDAQKKYPPKNGAYPPGTRNPHDASGVVSSPYPPYQQYDCSKINHGGLVLDIRAKHVFVYP